MAAILDGRAINVSKRQLPDGRWMLEGWQPRVTTLDGDGSVRYSGYTRCQTIHAEQDYTGTPEVELQYDYEDRLVSRCEYRWGVPHGLHRMSFMDGSRWVECHYFNGKPSGWQAGGSCGTGGWHAIGPAAPGADSYVEADDLRRAMKRVRFYKLRMRLLGCEYSVEEMLGAAEDYECERWALLEFLASPDCHW